MFTNTPHTSTPTYFIGLDLGQAQDYSALCVMERYGTHSDNYVMHCRHLQRWQLRTSYPTIVADTVRIVTSKKIQRWPGVSSPSLVVDATGVGAPVIDLFKRERMDAHLMPVQITGGADESTENGFHRVPKRNLVSTVQVYLQENRLHVAEKLPEAKTLTRELENFQVKINDLANDSYGAWRDGTHDDLVLAVALALWAGNKSGSGSVDFVDWI